MTRLYLHSASSAVGGTLPTAEQSTRTAAANFDAQTVNRSMDETKGSVQVTISRASLNGTDSIVYITKFISSALDMTSLSANTWTYNFAAQLNDDANMTYPVISTGNAKFNKLPLTCYVWRPGTGTKVGNIIDADSAGTTNEYFDCAQGATNGNQEFAENGTFTGSAVASMQTGDVIVLEAWAYQTDTATTDTISYFLDGGTVTTISTTVVSDHASFLETPETLTFQGAAADTTFPLYRSYGSTSFMPAVASRTF